MSLFTASGYLIDAQTTFETCHCGQVTALHELRKRFGRKVQVDILRIVFTCSSHRVTLCCSCIQENLSCLHPLELHPVGKI